MSERAPWQGPTDPFATRLEAGEDAALSAALRCSETMGRPLGEAAFLHRLEGFTGRRLKPQKRGPKPKGPKKSALSL